MYLCHFFWISCPGSAVRKNIFQPVGPGSNLCQAICFRALTDISQNFQWFHGTVGRTTVSFSPSYGLESQLLPIYFSLRIMRIVFLLSKFFFCWFFVGASWIKLLISLDAFFLLLPSYFSPRHCTLNHSSSNYFKHRQVLANTKGSLLRKLTILWGKNFSTLTENRVTSTYA